MFNKPQINEDELRKTQMKKAKFLAKLSKFQNFEKTEENPRKISDVKKRAEIFEKAEDCVDKAEEEAERERKSSFQRIKGQFLIIENLSKSEVIN